MGIAKRTAVVAAGAHLLALLALAAAPSAAQPTAYPTKAVRVIVPDSPGTARADYIVGIISYEFARRLGVSVVRDNRPRAGGVMAAELAAGSPADGYTLLEADFALAVNPHLVKPAYDPVKDFAPVILLGTRPHAVLVNQAVAAASVSELVALARSKPGELRYASVRNGSEMHLAAELFNLVADTKMTRVGYNFLTYAFRDQIAGETQLSFPDWPSAESQIRQGRLRALAVTSAQRLSAAPSLPTLDESGLRGYAVEQWYGIVVPRSTSREVVAKLNRELAATIVEPYVRKRLTESGFYGPLSTQPEYFGEFIKAEVAKWADVIRKAGVRAE